MTTSEPKPPPLWEWRLGRRVLLRFPTGLGTTAEVILLGVSLLELPSFSMELLAGVSRWAWLEWAGLVAALLQGGMALASLGARRIQRRRTAAR